VPEIFIIVITLLSLVYFLTLQILENALDKIPSSGRIIKNPNKFSVTVIVCARNEEKNLTDLFSCLEQQKTNSIDVEFIVVNDRSEDKTAELIEIQAKKDKRFSAIHINDRIAGFAPKKRAIDTAIQQARGDILLLTDADGRPQPGWIDSMLSNFKNDADMVVGYAPYTANEQSSTIKKIMALEYFSIAMISASTAGLNYPITCVGTNMAYRKKVYQEVGGFGEFKSFISGDDDLFLMLVREKKRYNIQYATNQHSQVYNDPPKSLSQFINQRLRFASKGFDYPFKVAFGLSIYVIFNLLIPAGLILGFLGNLELLQLMAAIILVKTFFEYKYVRKAAKILNDSRFTNYYFLTAILHLPYVLFFAIFGQLKLFKWAENEVEHGVLEKTGKP